MLDPKLVPWMETATCWEGCRGDIDNGVGLERTGEGAWGVMGAVCLCYKSEEVVGMKSGSQECARSRRCGRVGLLVADLIVR